MAPFAPPPDQFWRTDGTSGTWTSTNWSAAPSATGGTAFTANGDAQFTENSTVTFATVSIGNVTVAANKTVTVAEAGTLSMNGAVRTFDIGSGGLLDWQSQTVTANSAAGITKNSTGTLRLDAWTFTTNMNGGFTLNNGTVIVSGDKALGNGALTLNAGTLQSSGTRNFAPTSLTIGGNFTFAGTGNATFGMPVDLGGTTRTITNSITSGNRMLSGVVSGNAGVGLSFSGSGLTTLSGANTYSGDTTISSGTLALSGSGSIDSSANIVFTGAATFDVQNLTTSLTLASGQGLRFTGIVGTGTIATSASKGLTTAANSPLHLIFNGTTAPLTISGPGTITLQSGNPVTVVPTAALGAGDYVLISKGASGTVGGSVPTLQPIYNGGLAAGMIATLQISADQLILHVAPPSSTLVVTKTADTDDGFCDADCSLREAINIANVNGDTTTTTSRLAQGRRRLAQPRNSRRSSLP